MTTDMETKARKAKVARFWKGLGYIATGVVGIVLAVVFSGMTLSFMVEQPEPRPILAITLFLVALITGSTWAGILIWKGISLHDNKT